MICSVWLLSMVRCDLGVLVLTPLQRTESVNKGTLLYTHGLQYKLWNLPRQDCIAKPSRGPLSSKTTYCVLRKGCPNIDTLAFMLL